MYPTLGFCAHLMQRVTICTKNVNIYTTLYYSHDRLCGLVVRVSGCRYRGPGFDPRRYQIFWVVVGLERGPLSLVRSTEELLERKKVAAPGLENRD